MLSGLGGFGFTWAVARGSGAEGAGVVLTLTTWFMLLAGVAKIGMDTTLVREGGRVRAGASATSASALLPWTLGPAVLLATSIGLAVVAASPALAPIILPGTQAPVTAMIVAGGIALPAAVLTTVSLALLRGIGTIGPFVWIEQILKPTGRTLAALVLLALGISSVAAQYAAWLVPVWIGAGFAWWTLRRALTGGQRGAMEREERHRVWRYSGPRAAAQIVDMANTSLGTIMLGALAGAAAAGQFATAFRVIIFGQLAFQAVRLLLAPALAALLASRRFRDADETFATGTVLIVLVAWPVFLVCLVLPEQVLTIFGPTFTDAAPTLQVLALSGLLLALVGNQGSVVLMSGYSLWALAASVVGLTANVIVAAALIPALGSTAAAVGWTGGIFLEGVVLAVGVRRLGIRPLPTAALKAALWTLATLGAGLVAFRALYDQQGALASAALIAATLTWTALSLPMARKAFFTLTHQG